VAVGGVELQYAIAHGAGPFEFQVVAAVNELMYLSQKHFFPDSSFAE
jgi:hypothetical protein